MSAEPLGVGGTDIRIAYLIIAALLLACEPDLPPVGRSARPLQEITVAGGSEDFVDLKLSIEAIEDRPTETVVRAAGLHRGRRVGLRLVVAKGMKPGVNAQGIDRSAFRVGGISIQSTGSESDSFVGALAQLYGLKAAGKMRSAIDFVAFPLEGDPENIADEHLNFKVFHDTENEADEYCELYVHVDIPQSAVEIHEKDPGYRSQVVKAFVPKTAA